MAVGLDKFYNTLRPFAHTMVDQCGGHSFDRTVRNDSEAFWHRAKIRPLARAKLFTLTLTTVATEAAIDLLAFSSGGYYPDWLDRVGKRQSLRYTDHYVAVHLQKARAVIVAAHLPEKARTQEFADCARSLSLPHIARVIDVTVQRLPLTPMMRLAKIAAAPGS